MQNISENILNRVISKNIQADLRKYKMGGKKGERGTSKGDRTRSPAARRDRSAAYSEHDEEHLDQGSLGDLSREVSHYLNSLNTSGQNKMSLLRMQIIKCDDNSSIYSKIRSCLNRGDLD